MEALATEGLAIEVRRSPLLKKAAKWKKDDALNSANSTNNEGDGIEGAYINVCDLTLL